MKPISLLFASTLMLISISCKKKSDDSSSAPLPEPEYAAVLKSNVNSNTDLASTESYAQMFANSMAATEISPDAYTYQNDPSVSGGVRGIVRNLNEDMVDIGFNNFSHSQVRSVEGGVFYSAYEPVPANQNNRNNCMAVILNPTQGNNTFSVIEGPIVVGLAQTSNYLVSQGLSNAMVRDIMFPTFDIRSGAASFDIFGGDSQSYQSKSGTVEVEFSVMDRDFNGIVKKCGVAHVVATGTVEGVGENDTDLPLNIDHTWVFPL